MKRQLDWPEVYRQRKFLLPAFRQRSRASILSRDATLAKSCPDPRRARIDNSRRSINLNSAPCGEYLPAGNKRLRAKYFWSNRSHPFLRHPSHRRFQWHALDRRRQVVMLERVSLSIERE